MADKGANIDIVFRNGLKDFEVLPPPEIWDNIHPVINKKQKSFLILRVAALITVLLSLSYFAYNLSKNFPSGIDNPEMAFNDDSFSSSVFATIQKPVKITAQYKAPGDKAQVLTDEDISDNSIQADSQKNTSSDVAYIKNTNMGTFDAAKPMEGLTLASLGSARKYSYPINEPVYTSVSETNPMQGVERWSIAAMASPTYYSRFASGNDEFSQQMLASEQSVISYSGGLALSYKINKRLSLQTGLYYSSLGQNLDGISSYEGFQKYDVTKGDRNFEVITTSGTIYTNNADVFLASSGSGDRVVTNYTSDVFDPEKASLQYINNSMRQTFSYLELPVVLRYKIVDKTIGLNLIGGLSYNMLVNNSVYAISDGGKYLIGKTEGLNPVSLSSSLGMGMEYNFSNSLSFNLEPMFRYYINPFTEVAGSKFHPYSFGIFSGVSFKF